MLWKIVTTAVRRDVGFTSPTEIFIVCRCDPGRTIGCRALIGSPGSLRGCCKSKGARGQGSVGTSQVRKSPWDRARTRSFQVLFCVQERTRMGSGELHNPDGTRARSALAVLPWSYVMRRRETQAAVSCAGSCAVRGQFLQNPAHGTAQRHRRLVVLWLPFRSANACLIGKKNKKKKTIHLHPTKDQRDGVTLLPPRAWRQWKKANWPRCEGGCSALQAGIHFALARPWAD